MWVVQEIAMAQSDKVMFHCGHRMMRLETLSVAIDFTNIRGATPSQLHWHTLTGPLRELKAAVELKAEPWRRLPPDFTFTGLLSLTTSKDATMPVDKAFGLYSIAKHLGWHLPAPDYNKPVAQVFIETTQFAIQSDQSLEVLNFSGRPTNIEGLPSWAGDFGQPPYGAIRPTADIAAARDSTPFFWFDATGRQITLMGRLIDVISTCGRTLDWEPQSATSMVVVSARAKIEAAWDTLQQWIYILGQHQQPHDNLNGKSFDEAFMELLFINSTRYREPGVVQRLYRALRNQAQSPPTQWPYPGNPEFRSALEHVVISSGGKAFALTEGKRLAMVPATTRLDDVVVVFAGSKVPSILRQQGDGFLFVGSAYVHGVMHGELWTGDQSDMQEFTLI
jgi:hypothetical protein